MYSATFLKIFIKLLRSPFPAMFQTFLTQRALGDSKNTRGAHKGHLSTRKILQGLQKCTRRALEGHSKAIPWVLQGALEHLRHSDTQKELGHSGTWPLEWHLETRALYLAYSKIPMKVTWLLIATNNVLVVQRYGRNLI